MWINLQIDAAELAIPRELLLLDLDDKITKTYQSHMVNISVLFGANQTTAERDYLKVLQFERQLANVSLNESEIGRKL